MADHKILIIGAAGLAAYYFFFRTPTGVTTATATAAPAGTTVPGAVVPTTVAVNSSSIPVNYGINAGYTSNGLSSLPVSNYAAITAANPNQANPNYQLSQSELLQYENNYLDIAQGVATWPGGLSNANLQKHWTLYGAPQQRVFCPIVPPYVAKYVPPPVVPKSSSSGSWVSTALQVGGSVAVALLGTEDTQPLTDGDLQLLFTGTAVIKDLLPFFNSSSIGTVNYINTKIDNTLAQYV